LDAGMAGELAAFLALSVVVICTPGPDTALTVRNALVGGRSGGVWTAGGVAAGQAVWTVAAGLGVATVLHASEPAFIALKLAGAAYLVYLGVGSLRAAWSGRSGHRLDAPRAALTPARAFRQGLLNNLANPKMAAFFTSLLPQIVPASHEGGAALAQLLPLGFAFCVLTFAWLAAYSVALARARRFLDRPRWRRGLDAVAGGVLVGFGIRLAATEPA
jgi:threonine/homoserine/homoserine lactone efflux protein